MFVISDELYQQLEPFIQIPSKNKYPENFAEKNKVKDTVKYITKDGRIVIDINNSGPDDFEKIKGIGPAKAKSIFNYRIMLGGFISKNQIKEAYGITDSLFQTVENNLLLSDVNPVQLNINTDNPSELKHPYIPYAKAGQIIKYRKMHGDFKSVEDLKSVALVNDELYRKLAPYLKIK